MLWLTSTSPSLLETCCATSSQNRSASFIGPTSHDGCSKTLTHNHDRSLYMGAFARVDCSQEESCPAIPGGPSPKTAGSLVAEWDGTRPVHARSAVPLRSHSSFLDCRRRYTQCSGRPPRSRTAYLHAEKSDRLKTGLFKDLADSLLVIFHEGLLEQNLLAEISVHLPDENLVDHVLRLA